ncbi:MAG TPA: hypothetical protein VK092_02220, partial [Deinococcales bacterium]|nr:hypothetical protein [Deinococcales bacterium]
MKRLLPFLALLVLLAGCTGTTPDQLPVLLFVTHERDGDQLAALVADRAGQDDRFLYLEDTETVLPGTPLALDVAGRGARRDEAFVLLETPGGEFELARFDLRGIDADAAVLPAPERTNLTDVLVDGSDGALEDGDVCLRDVQVDAAGSVLAFMNVPSECDSSNDDAPSVLVLDTDGG